ncbi:MAG: hypothetical protein GXP16_05815 [Gammaproteobacteria bacterium]|nr:hypothetical protein [Gammaproteobacteria bacterium]
MAEPPEEEVPEEVNASLIDVLDLLAQEVERLKVGLEWCRLSQHADKERLISWYVQQIDMRQDRLEEMKAVILASGDDAVH